MNGLKVVMSGLVHCIRVWRINIMKTYTVTVDDDGTKRWYLNDNPHREDGPAIEYTNGTKYWYLDGNLHRSDGPAIEHPNGTNEWYLNGKRHRTDGPAVEYDTGGKYWYLDGKRHRVDGPAVECYTGTKEWYLGGVKYTEADWRKRVQKVKSPCVGKIVEVDGVKYKLVEA